MALIQAGVDALAAHPEALVAYPDWVRIDETGTVFDEVRTGDYSFVEMVLWHDCLPGPSTFFRRRLLSKVQGRDPAFRYTADFDFWLRAALFGPFVRVPHLYGCFRVHSASTRVLASPEMASEHPALLDSFYRLGSPARDRRAARRRLLQRLLYGRRCGGAGLQSSPGLFCESLETQQLEFSLAATQAASHDAHSAFRR
jgi:GT2 family glycosyltransferase